MYYYHYYARSYILVSLSLTSLTFNTFFIFMFIFFFFFFFSSRRRHTRYWRDWSSDVCSSDLGRHPRPSSRSWDVAGLRGTGSFDWTVEDVFLPERRTMPHAGIPLDNQWEIGRASCRERV